MKSKVTIYKIDYRVTLPDGTMTGGSVVKYANGRPYNNGELRRLRCHSEIEVFQYGFLYAEAVITMVSQSEYG